MTSGLFNVRASSRANPSPLLLVAAFVSFTALAQSPRPSLEETVVTATRVAQPLSDLVADVSIIDRDTIEKSGAVGVADLLAQLPGVEISRNGGVGTTSSVFIRGAETRFTAVYIDGVRIDSQATGGATWEAIPLTQIDRIEVLRGPAAAVYGSDAIGGVVQLFTKRGEGPAKPYVGIGVGSRSLREANAGVSGAAAGFDYSLGVSHEESRGFNARPIDGANPDNDGYRRNTANARLGFQINPQQRVEATVLATDLNAGYDDFSYDPLNPVDDRSKHRLVTGGLSWRAQWTDAYSTKLSVSESRDRFETTPSPYRTTTELRNYLFQNEYRVGAHLFTAALERREDRLDNPALDEFSTSIDRSRSQNAVALGYGFRAGAHTLQLNLRRDHDSEFGGQTTGSAAYGFAITPAWRITASAGTAFRAPTLYQRFSQYGVAGLQPEKGRNIEAGLHYAEGPATANLTLYRNNVRNLIGFDFDATNCDSGGFGCFANTGRARYEGITLAGSYRVGADVTLRASLDVQNPRNLDSGKLLALRARRHAAVGADWRVAGWTFGAELQASSERFDNAANTRAQRLPGYGLINLSASRPIGRDFSLVARIDNLADRDYQLVRGYATAGRTAYLGLKWTPL